MPRRDGGAPFGSAPPGPGGGRGGARSGPTNAFGLGEAIAGLAVGFVLASLASALAGALAHRGAAHPSGLASDAASLLGLWAGFVAAAIVASRRREALARGQSAAAGVTARRPVLDALRDDFGLALKLWPDVPLGVALGVACQYVLVPALELPLVPFVPHLFRRLGGPAEQLTGGEHGMGLAVLGVLVCVGSPLVEELFFRGLLLRALGGRLAPLGPRLGPVVATVLTGLVFALVHFEPLQLTALAGFGVVLCVLAWRTGRLGPGIVAHAAFNATTFVALALSR